MKYLQLYVNTLLLSFCRDAQKRRVQRGCVYPTHRLSRRTSHGLHWQYRGLRLHLSGLHAHSSQWCATNIPIFFTSLYMPERHAAMKSSFPIQHAWRGIAFRPQRCNQRSYQTTIPALACRNACIRQGVIRGRASESTHGQACLQEVFFARQDLQ